MFERYKGPLLAGLIFAAFLIAFLALVHPRAFAQTMGEYGSILKDSGSNNDSFKSLDVHPTDMGSKLDWQMKTDTGTDFGKSQADFKSSIDASKSDKKFDSGTDFKSSDFKANDDFKPSFKAN